MFRRPTIELSRSSAFAAETVRALSSTLLLLGLIGDRRARWRGAPGGRYAAQAAAPRPKQDM